MGELVAGFIELLFEILLASRKTAPYVLVLIALAIIGVGVYYFIGA